METVKFKLTDGGHLPEYKTETCCDCYASISPYSMVLLPCCYEDFLLGFMMALPKGHKAVIRLLEELSKKGIEVQVRVIDSDYKDSVLVHVTNNSNKPFLFYNGDKICQMEILKEEQLNFENCDYLSNSLWRKMIR